MSLQLENLFLDRASLHSTTPPVGVAIHKYKSTTDTLATISASGYFNSAYSLPPSNNSTQPIQLQVGDVMVANGTNGTALYQVTAVTPNVTLAAL